MLLKTKIAHRLARISHKFSPQICEKYGLIPILLLFLGLLTISFKDESQTNDPTKTPVETKKREAPKTRKVTRDRALYEYLYNARPLSGEELVACVSGNTIIGRTCHSKSIYEIYFDPTGKMIFRKNHSDKDIHSGNWWVKGKDMYSKLPTYKKGVNHFQFYHLLGNAYVIYNITETCGPAGTFSECFLVFKGDILNFNKKK